MVSQAALIDGAKYAFQIDFKQPHQGKTRGINKEVVSIRIVPQPLPKFGNGRWDPQVSPKKSVVLDGTSNGTSCRPFLVVLILKSWAGLRTGHADFQNPIWARQAFCILLK